MGLQAQILLLVEQKEVLLLIPTAFHTKGQWKLDGDKLTTVYDFSNAEMLSFDFDTRNFPQSSLERMKDSLEIKKEMMRKDILESFRHQDAKADYVVSFDKSGNTMMFTHEETTPSGNKQNSSFQLNRKLN